MVILRPAWRASASDRPTVPTGGWEKTALATSRVIEAHRFAAKLGLGEGGALADGHGGQVDAVGDVAHRPDVLDIGAGERIHDHGAALVERHAGRLQPQARGIGLAAGGEHHHIGLHRVTAIETADDARIRLFQRGMPVAEDDLDPALLDLAGQMRTGRRRRSRAGCWRRGTTASFPPPGR